MPCAPAACAAAAPRLVQLGHYLDGARQHLIVGQTLLERGGDRAGAERLGQHERITGPAAGVGEHVGRVDHAGDGEAVLGLGIVDRVPAHDRGAGGADDVVAPAQDLGEHLGSELLDRPRDQVQRGERPATHRVHVRERVGGRDPPEVVRVVDDRREEVGGLDDGQVLAQAVDGGVIAGRGADEEVGVGRLRQRLHNRGEQRRGHLARAPRAVGQRSELDGGHSPIMANSAGRVCTCSPCS